VSGRALRTARGLSGLLILSGERRQHAKCSVGTSHQIPPVVVGGAPLHQINSLSRPSAHLLDLTWQPGHICRKLPDSFMRLHVLK